MPQAIGDPEEIMQFARTLKAFTESVKGASDKLMAAEARLGQSWRDQENQRFATEFDQTMKSLARFLVLAEKQLPYLVKKAQRLQEYLNQR